MKVHTIFQETLAIFCESVSDAVVSIDQNQCVWLFNPAAAAVFAISAGEVVGQPLEAHPATQVLIPLFEQTNGSQEAATTEVVLPSGEVYRARLLVVPEHGQTVILSMLADSQPADGRLVDLVDEIGHELRSPIAGAKGSLDVVGAAGTLNEQQAKFMQRAQLNLDHLLGLVDEMLDMTWLEAGGTLKLCEIDLGRLAQRAAARLEGYAHFQEVQMVLELPEECLVRGDARRLESAIGNLIHNAIKYSPDGGQVQVSALVDGQTATVRVADQGLGIAAEYLPHIFERFYRVHTPATDQIGGSGLGLTIVKAVVEKHGGTIAVNSLPGEGSVFEFSLPAG
jgi:two-component system phosphate regulon sensor histidine kinase PhoR